MVARLYLVSVAFAGLFAAASSLTAQAQQPVLPVTAALDQQLGPAVGASSLADGAGAAGADVITVAAPADAASANAANPSANADTAEPADFADPAETAAGPTAALTPGAARAGADPGHRAMGAMGAAAEVGEKYQISQSDADSFLGRIASRLKGLVEHAMSYLGTPYRRGGSSRRGVDCSGLVDAVYGQAGLELPRTAAEQFAKGEEVAANDLQPGDLVFFHNTYKHGISHVGIFIGGGRFIHAAGHREGVIVSDLARPYYRSRFAGARRLTAHAAAGAGLPGLAGLPSAAPDTANRTLATAGPAGP
jgi:cell wall-associated NlpC family hydrolase